MATEIQSDILERLRVIVRRDLKLGPEARIADDMALFNSELDLDSLDILLLVTSIEKEFGFKIPSHAVGKEAFANLSTLARYIQEGPLDSGKKIDYLARLPHGPAFRFISGVTKVVEGESAEGKWDVSGKEDFFAGHFPDRPLVPGVLITEALAQLSGLTGTAADGTEGKLVHMDIRFEQSVVPPAEILLRTRLTRTIGALRQFEVVATVAGDIVASGSLTLHRGG